MHDSRYLVSIIKCSVDSNTIIVLKRLEGKVVSKVKAISNKDRGSYFITIFYYIPRD